MVPNFNYDFSSEYRSAILSNSVTHPVNNSNTSVTNTELSSDPTSSVSPLSSNVTEQTSPNDPEEDEFGDFEEAAPVANTTSPVVTNPSPFVTNPSHQIPVNPTIQTFSSADVSSNQNQSSRYVLDATNIMDQWKLLSQLTNEEPLGDKYAAFKELSIDTDQSESLPPLESFSAQPINGQSDSSTAQPISSLDSFTSQNLEPNTKPLATSFSLSAVRIFIHIMCHDLWVIVYESFRFRNFQNQMFPMKISKTTMILAISKKPNQNFKFQNLIQSQFRPQPRILAQN